MSRIQKEEKSDSQLNPDKKNISSSFTYKDSGVNLEKANEAINLIKKPVFSTFSSNVLNNLTSYAGLFKLDIKDFTNPVLVSSTDGVGTKLLVAKLLNEYRFIGQDLVAMCINDILCCGAKPLFFLDYIACDKINPGKVKTIVESIAGSCKECRTALIGGETAEMPDMYKKNDIDLAGFTVGVVEESRIIKPARVVEGDIIIGIPSSGIHSNGFSLIRKIIKEKKLKLQQNYGTGYGKTLGETLITPTKLYYKFIKKILFDKKNTIDIHGLAHITGGGFYENINRIIPPEMNAIITGGSWPIPEIFKFLAGQGSIAHSELYRVFNMGIGMIIIVSAENLQAIKKAASSLSEDVFEIGKVTYGDGKVIIK